MRNFKPVLIAALSLMIAHTAWAYDDAVHTGHDGDTCTLADGAHVRIQAIDALEVDQPYGAQAGALINQLVTGHHVDVRPTVDRSYNRIVADLVLPDRRSVGAVLVERGYAWVEARCNNDPSMPTREHAAQQAHLGLWADARPREWRHEHGHTHVLQRTWRLW